LTEEKKGGERRREKEKKDIHKPQNICSGSTLHTRQH
jgi:hypothetical protein